MIYGILLIYYVLVNVVAFALYGLDKAKAKNGKWRIPEKTLFGIAYAGGGFGAFLGMKVFRHKTKHLSFQILIPLSLILHIGIIVVVLIKCHIGN